jgi:hypothetical protein
VSIAICVRHYSPVEGQSCERRALVGVKVAVGLKTRVYDPSYSSTQHMQVYSSSMMVAVAAISHAHWRHTAVTHANIAYCTAAHAMYKHQIDMGAPVSVLQAAQLYSECTPAGNGGGQMANASSSEATL